MCKDVIYTSKVFKKYLRIRLNYGSVNFDFLGGKTMNKTV